MKTNEKTAADTMPCPSPIPAATLGHHAAADPRHGSNLDDIAAALAAAVFE